MIKIITKTKDVAQTQITTHHDIEFKLGDETHTAAVTVITTTDEYTNTVEVDCTLANESELPELASEDVERLFMAAKDM